MDSLLILFLQKIKGVIIAKISFIALVILSPKLRFMPFVSQQANFSYNRAFIFGEILQKPKGFTLISKKILSAVGRTNAEYGLIREGDRVLLGLSGGKDSMLLATILKRMQSHAPFKFDFKAITIDYGRGGEYEYIIDYCAKHEIPYELYRTKIFEALEEKKRPNSSYCSFCSRMRRGALYSKAMEGGFNKIALAHHLDDAAESFVMNFSYNGALRSMPPIYRAGNGLFVIRPLIFVRERQIIDFIKSNEIYIAPDCNCPINWLPSDKKPFARESAKAMLREIEAQNKDFFISLKKAFCNIHAGSFCDKEFLEV